MTAYEKLVLKRMAKNVKKEAENRGIPTQELWRQIRSQLVKQFECLMEDVY